MKEIQKKMKDKNMYICRTPFEQPHMINTIQISGKQLIQPSVYRLLQK